MFRLSGDTVSEIHAAVKLPVVQRAQESSLAKMGWLGGVPLLQG
jgi:hypothetical protein